MTDRLEWTFRVQRESFDLDRNERVVQELFIHTKFEVSKPGAWWTATTTHGGWQSYSRDEKSEPPTSWFDSAPRFQDLMPKILARAQSVSWKFLNPFEPTREPHAR